MTETIDSRAREIFAAMKPRCSCNHPANTGSRDHAPDCTWERAAEEAWEQAEEEADDANAAEEEEDDEEEATFCEECDQPVVAVNGAAIMPEVSNITGRWICGSCKLVEQHTGLRASKGRERMEAPRG